MNRFLLTIAYDGTHFCGWQQQNHQRSVLGEMEKIFARIFKIDAYMLGASRTDVGVHALGQVMRCLTPLDIKPERLQWVWNNSLPSDIHIRKAQYAPEDFHPWYKVKEKIYYYHIFTQRPLPFVARYGWYIPQRFDLDIFNKALKQYCGTHDFRSLCSADDQREDTVRTINAISLSYIKRFNVYRVTVKGKSFLRHMIRRMIGAAFAVASRSTLSVEYINTLLKEKNPHQALPNAPGNGLLLRKIYYET